MSETAALGLTTHRQNNNLKSLLLLAAFPLLLAALVGFTFFFFGLLLLDAESPHDGFSVWGLTPVVQTGSAAADFGLAAVYAWWPLVFGAAAIWMLIGYFFNARIIRSATGAHPVDRTQEPRLYNLLENLCISRGLITPRLHVIETEALNAFASGIDQKSYAVTVTRGLLLELDDDELEAVLAHELTHIMGRDTRLLVITVVFVGMISFLAQMLWRMIGRVPLRGSKKGGAGAALLIGIAAVIFAIGYMLALVLRFAISRRREYLADAGSVDMTKNPGAMIRALRKIAQKPHIPGVSSEARQMFIENPPARFSLGGLLATHPPVEKRIQILEALGGDLPGPWTRKE